MAAVGSLKALLFPPLLDKLQNKGTQGIRARYGAELPPFISIVRYPGRPVILGMDQRNENDLNCNGSPYGLNRRGLRASPDRWQQHGTLARLRYVHSAVTVFKWSLNELFAKVFRRKVSRSDNLSTTVPHNEEILSEMYDAS